MLRAVILFATLLVTGCAADISDLRKPQTADEQAQVSQQIERGNSPMRRLGAANEDICRAATYPKDRYCYPRVNINYSWKAGAFSTVDTIYLSTAMMEALKTDDGIAFVMAHEWAHILLGHSKSKVRNAKIENDADCVGAILTYRAGYDVAVANRDFAALTHSIETGQTAYSVAMFVLIGAIPESGYHPSSAARAASIDSTAFNLSMLKMRNAPVDKTAIEQICSVKFLAPAPLDVSGLTRVE